MSRSAGRWLVLGLLLAAVIALGIYNTYSNNRLVKGLVDGDPQSFSELASRQDAYIFLQAEEPATRRQIARNLGSWNDERAVGLMVTLLPDPDSSVRSNLVDSLAAAAKREPMQLGLALSAAGPSAVAALIEAATRDPAVSLDVLTYALDTNADNPNPYLLAKRIGSPSKPTMIDTLESGSASAVLLSADVLAGLPLSEIDRKSVGASIFRRYSRAADQAYKDKLLPLMAKFAPSEALVEFRSVATDQTAPSDLRVAATQALITLGDAETLSHLRRDADTNVAAILK